MKGNAVVLILDTDKPFAQKLIDETQSSFSKVYFQSDANLFLSELNEVRPDMVFMNLSLNQREMGFSIMERINTLEVRPLCFGYLDKGTPELLAHAIENGLSDVFSSPFIGDRILTKVNKHVRKQARNEKKNAWKLFTPPLSAELTLSFKLSSIDEGGFTLRSRHFIAKGTKFNLSNVLVNDIFGKNSIQMMVTRSSFHEEDELGYLLYVEPVTPSDSNGAALRSYIMKKQNL